MIKSFKKRSTNPMSQSMKSILWDLANKTGQELGYEVVEITFLREGPKRILRVFIDHPEGIGIQDCERFSKRLSNLLDEADPITSSYLLEISSPGIDRPLTKPEHFRRFTGETIQLRLYSSFQGRKNIKGRLEGWSDEEEGKVLVDVDGEKFIIPWTLISKARLYYRD